MNGSGKDFLCHLTDLDDLSCKSFNIKIKSQPTDIFIVRKDGQVFAYQNVCPHAQAPLEWNPDDFLDDKKETIICAMHGARFTIEEGACVEGPCDGVGLTAVAVEIKEGNILLAS